MERCFFRRAVAVPSDVATDEHLQHRIIIPPGAIAGVLEIIFYLAAVAVDRAHPRRRSIRPNQLLPGDLGLKFCQ